MDITYPGHPIKELLQSRVDVTYPKFNKKSYSFEANCNQDPIFRCVCHFLVEKLSKDPGRPGIKHTVLDTGPITTGSHDQSSRVSFKLSGKNSANTHTYTVF